MAISQIEPAGLAAGAARENFGTQPNDPATKTALNASGDAPIYACRAWVNFNGQGTVAIRASGNVSSITDVGTGKYRVNFISAFTGVDYCGLTGFQRAGTNDFVQLGFDRTTGYDTVETFSGGGVSDFATVQVGYVR